MSTSSIEVSRIAPTPLSLALGVNAKFICDCGCDSIRVGIYLTKNGDNFIRLFECIECGLQYTTGYHIEDGTFPALLPAAIPVAPPIPDIEITPDRTIKWRGRTVKMSLSHVAIVEMLISRPGENVSYDDLYTCIRPKGFHAGAGDTGWHINVRGAMKRIRTAFLAVDPSFDRIENYSGYGYQWVVK